jgi:hypothetical protein
VRQAYDELARPGRLIAQLSLLPSIVVIARRRPEGLLVLAGCAFALAEVGRRRGNGRAVWPAACSLAAPFWVAERSICVWLALLVRVLFGGIRYHGVLIARPASSETELRHRAACQGMAR